MTIRFRNEIGIAILSTDRPHCLERLLKSMEDHTLKDGLSVFVIDDSENPDECEKITTQYDWTIFHHTGERIGIAKNTNRAMKAIAEFPFKIIMNNDVEVIDDGWDLFYSIGAHQTELHHFCFQQEGLWGAGTKKRPQTVEAIGQREVKTIHNYPQGAILAYDQKAFETVGYFDAESFRGYGKSHWDWSFRISESGIQPEGIHDLVGSNRMFKVHDETCTTPQRDRLKDYQRNTKVLEEVRSEKSRIYIDYA